MYNIIKDLCIYIEEEENMKLKRWNLLVINIIVMIILVFILGKINLKINKIEVELTFYILPVILGVLFGIIITYLSMKRMRYLEKIIRERTKTLEYYATMDDMTNTYNRRMGMKMLRYHFILSKRHKNSLSVCFIDIDRLKSVNDTFGHAKGDELIKDISEMMRSSIRESDIISRMGGDEFLIILPECDIVNARKVIKVFIEKVRTHNKIYQKDYKASVSFGLSESSYCDDKTVENLVAEADNKMYVMGSRQENADLQR